MRNSPNGPIEASSLSEIVASLRSLTPACADLLIGVDGWDGAGKTHLARSLAEELDGIHLSVDDFLENNQGGYIDHVRYGDLRSAIVSASGSPVVVDGCCLIEVFGRVGKPFVHLYVKRLIASGLWLDCDFLETCPDADNAIAHMLDEVRAVGAYLHGGNVSSEGLGGLREDLIRYHFDRRPHERATIVFCRPESA